MVERILAGRHLWLATVALPVGLPCNQEVCNRLFPHSSPLPSAHPLIAPVSRSITYGLDATRPTHPFRFLIFKILKESLDTFFLMIFFYAVPINSKWYAILKRKQPNKNRSGFIYIILEHSVHITCETVHKEHKIYVLKNYTHVCKK